MKTYTLDNVWAEIIRPGMSLPAWLARQTDKPYALINASLYDFDTRKPYGTIVEDGKQVYDAGNGFGFGTLPGAWAFGGPWDCAWDDYFTGFPGLVRDGKYTPPAFDNIIFPAALNRIGILGASLAIGVADCMDIFTFGRAAEKTGFQQFINLDGGGSRFVYINGCTIYNSNRIPYNAIAFYRIGQQQDDKPEPCPFPEPTVNVNWGSVGASARWVQWQLRRHGYDIDVDGIFGPASRRVLAQYQIARGLKADGICGARTRAALKEAT